jgi:DinB family protein
MPTTPPQTPYSADLGTREPLTAMRDAVARIRQIASGWTPAQYERSYAPGKWTARQILVHLVQTEIALGNRARMALSTRDYAAQAFDQDGWMEIEGSSRETDGSRGSGNAGVTGEAALAALVAMNAVNRALFESLTPAQRAMPFSHPEYGALTVDWLIHQMGGHLLHHVEQVERLSGARC